MLIITPSYSEDFSLCRELNASISVAGVSGARHQIVVPDSDRGLFSALESEETEIVIYGEILDKNFLKIPSVNVWLNGWRLWPPVRGWIVQQIVKLSAAAASDSEVVMIADSDLVLFPSVANSATSSSGEVPLYRKVDAVDGSLPRHRLWDSVGRRLLGLPGVTRYLLPDYVCCPCLWVPEYVRGMLRRVELVSGGPWQSTVAAQLHFSEMVLYGLYVDNFISQDREIAYTDDMRCLTYYDERPLDASDIDEFVDQCRASDIALMISAKSGTDAQVRRAVLERVRSREGGSRPS